MKAETFTPFSTVATHGVPSIFGSVFAALRSLVEDIRHAHETRVMRSAFSQLDDASLRDIGIATDEIPRVVAGEDFTPRAWQ